MAMSKSTITLYDLNDQNRIHPEIDAWMIESFAQNTLKMDPDDFPNKLIQQHPERNVGDAIDPFKMQWVNGNNESLLYRGNEIPRGKIWLQRGAPEVDGILRYGYTGWQWRVAPATANVSQSPKTLEVANLYDEWSREEGYPLANHYIITKYADGSHNIGFHFDKPKDILRKSLITIVKLGKAGRPFQIRRLGETKPFFDRVLAPGSALVMTLEANLKTQHAVPPVNNNDLTGSIVFRTITTLIPSTEVMRKISKTNYKRKRENSQ